MTTRTDAEHAYFARVPTRLLADLKAAGGQVLTFVEADSRLNVNQAALEAQAQQRRRASEPSTPVVVPPILFIPNPALVNELGSDTLSSVLSVRRGRL
jgi:hypothetical protein